MSDPPNKWFRAHPFMMMEQPALLPHCVHCGVALSQENWYPSLMERGSRICNACHRLGAARSAFRPPELKRRALSKTEVVCTKCGAPLTGDNWYPSMRTNNQRQCKSCHCKAVLSRLRTPRGSFANRVWFRKRGQELKVEVLSHYSGGPPRCTRRGYTDVRALSIDHVNSGGAQHGKKVKKMCEWFLRNEYPDGYAVLCLNCNWLKRYEKGEVPRKDKGPPVPLLRQAGTDRP